MTSAPVDSTTCGSRSATPPVSPRLPSSVAMTIVCARRLASIGLKTSSCVSAPASVSTRLPRARSSWPRKYIGAEPCPSATSRQVESLEGYANALPSGPITSRNWCALTSASQLDPRPRGSNTNSRVPAHPPRRDAWWIEKWRRSRKVRPWGIATETNCPGRTRSATSGATIVIEWYAPTRLAFRTSARTRFTVPPRDPRAPGRHLGGVVAEHQPLLDGDRRLRGRVALLQRPGLPSLATHRLDPAKGPGDRRQGGDTRDPRLRRRAADQRPVGARAATERGCPEQ